MYPVGSDKRAAVFSLLHGAFRPVVDGLAQVWLRDARWVLWQCWATSQSRGVVTLGCQGDGLSSCPLRWPPAPQLFQCFLGPPGTLSTNPPGRDHLQIQVFFPRWGAGRHLGLC